MKQALINNDASAAYLPHHEVALSVVKSDGAKPTTTPYPRVDFAASGNVAPWGSNNDFPQEIIKAVSPSTIVPPTLDWKTRALIGGGVMPFTLKGYRDDGSEILEPIFRNSEIDDFIFRNNIHSRYIPEITTDFYYFFNPFAEFVLSKNRDKITDLVAQEAAFCRWEIMDKATRRIKNCILSSDWPEFSESNSDKIPTFDIYDSYRIEKLRAGTTYKYIYPLSYPTPGKTYYQLSTWDGLRQSGWLAIAQSIPEWKKSLMKNQLTIKFHVMIPDYWWKWKYPDWENKKPEEKKTLREEEVNNFNDFMTDAKNAGKSIFTTFQYDEHIQKERPGWKIESVDNGKIPHGAYIEDSQEASSHLMYALGVDPTLIGNSPGSKMGAGSGSDKRVAYNIYVSLLKAHRDIILEPLNFVTRYNNWGTDIVWRFQDSLIQTLNTGTETKEVTQNQPIA